jgi:hypothetical protein
MARYFASSRVLAALALTGALGCDDGERTIGEQEQGLHRAFCELDREALIVQPVAEEPCYSDPEDPTFGRTRYQYTFEVVANDPRGRSGRFPDVGGTFLAVWSTPLDTPEAEGGEESCFHIPIDIPECTEAMRRAPHINRFELLSSTPVEPDNSCPAMRQQPIYRSNPVLYSDFTAQEVHEILATDESCAAPTLTIREL